MFIFKGTAFNVFDFEHKRFVIRYAKTRLSIYDPLICCLIEGPYRYTDLRMSSYLIELWQKTAQNAGCFEESISLRGNNFYPVPCLLRTSICKKGNFKISIQVTPKPSPYCVVKPDYVNNIVFIHLTFPISREDIRNLISSTNFYVSEMQVPAIISVINSSVVDFVSANEFCRGIAGGIIRKNRISGVVRVASKSVFAEMQALSLTSRFKYIAEYADSVESAVHKARQIRGLCIKKKFFNHDNSLKNTNHDLQKQ